MAKYPGICLHCAGRGNGGYEAFVAGDPEGAYGIGRSPDEARGHLLRELYLCGALDEPVLISIEALEPE